MKKDIAYGTSLLVLAITLWPWDICPGFAIFASLVVGIFGIIIIVSLFINR